MGEGCERWLKVQEGRKTMGGRRSKAVQARPAFLPFLDDFLSLVTGRGREGEREHSQTQNISAGKRGREG